LRDSDAVERYVAHAVRSMTGAGSEK
jgi:hypothetical protein